MSKSVNIYSKQSKQMNRFSLHRDNTTQVKFAYKAQSFFSLFIEKGNTLYTLSETATWTSHYAYLLFQFLPLPWHLLQYNAAMQQKTFPSALGSCLFASPFSFPFLPILLSFPSASDLSHPITYMFLCIIIINPYQQGESFPRQQFC